MKSTQYEEFNHFVVVNESLSCYTGFNPVLFTFNPASPAGRRSAVKNQNNITIIHLTLHVKTYLKKALKQIKNIPA